MSKGDIEYLCLLQLLWAEFDRNGYKLEITKKEVDNEN